MKLTRIAVGSVILGLVAVATVGAQETTVQARQERERARAVAERCRQEADKARETAEKEAEEARREADEAAEEARQAADEAVEEAREAAEEAAVEVREAQQGAEEESHEHADGQADCCRSKAKAARQDEKTVLRAAKLRKAEQALAQAGRSEDLEKLLSEISAGTAQAQVVMASPELKRSLEELAQLRVTMPESTLRLGTLMQSHDQQGGSNRRLEERVRALEERLGISSDGSERSLEERVAELERRTMGGQERHPRVLGLPRTPRAPGLAGVPGRPGAAALAVPRQPFPPAEAPEPPQPPEPSEPALAPQARKSWHVAPDASPAPSAPRRWSGSDLSPERRREVEEMMQRMRAQMDQLRTDMKRLRDELEHSGD